MTLERRGRLNLVRFEYLHGGRANSIVDFTLIIFLL